MGGRLGNRENFGVGRGILEQLPLVVGLADDLAVGNDDAPDGHLTDIEGALGFT
jgi:hypothetical protein